MDRLHARRRGGDLVVVVDVVAQVVADDDGLVVGGGLVAGQVFGQRQRLRRDAVRHLQVAVGHPRRVVGRGGAQAAAVGQRDLRGHLVAVALAQDKARAQRRDQRPPLRIVAGVHDHLPVGAQHLRGGVEDAGVGQVVGDGLGDDVARQRDRHVQRAVVGVVDELRFVVLGRLPAAVVIGVVGDGLPVDAIGQLLAHLHVHDQRVADVARPAQHQRVLVGVARPRAVGAQGGKEPRPRVLEGAPRPAGLGYRAADGRAGLQPRQAPGQQQRHQRRHQARAQEVELDAPVVAHGVAPPVAFLAGQVGDGHKEQGQQGVERQIAQQRPGAVVVVDDAQQHHPGRDDHAPHPAAPEGVPGRQIAEQPEDGRRLDDEDDAVAADAAADRLLHPVRLPANEVEDALAPRPLIGQRGADEEEDEEDAVDDGEDVGGAVGENAFRQQPAGHHRHRGDDGQHVQTVHQIGLQDGGAGHQQHRPHQQQ